jgi:predicted nucleic acid-binding protein
MSDNRVFVDTNILVYAYDIDAGEKHAKANAILSSLWRERTGALSTQILQEFYVTVTRKLTKPLSRRTAREILETYTEWAVYAPVPADVIAASRLEESHRLAFWDAMVVVAAQRSDAVVLLSEDLQAGRRIDGLRISNPLR